MGFQQPFVVVGSSRLLLFHFLQKGIAALLVLLSLINVAQGHWVWLRCLFVGVCDNARRWLWNGRQCGNEFIATIKCWAKQNHLVAAPLLHRPLTTRPDIHINVRLYLMWVT